MDLRKVDKEAKKKLKKVVEATSWSPVLMLSKWGVRSGHAYSAGLISGTISMLSWMGSRGKKGMHFGVCAATLIALGIALKEEE